MHNIYVYEYAQEYAVCTMLTISNWFEVPLIESGINFITIDLFSIAPILQFHCTKHMQCLFSLDESYQVERI